MSLHRLWVLLCLSCLGACQPDDQTYRIGILNYHSQLDPTVDGLRAGLAEQGFANTVELIYVGSVGQDVNLLEQEARRLLELNIDLLFTMGTEPTQAAKNVMATLPRNIPVVFSPLLNPVEEGFTTSLAQPSTGITGVHNANMAGKALEWLTLTMPDTRVVITFYHPEDRVSVNLVEALEKSAEAFPIDVKAIAIQEPATALNHLANLDQAHTLLVFPTPRLGPQTHLQQQALAAGIRVFGYNTPADFTLVSFSVDWFYQGKQASYLVSRILTGTDAATVAVEAADSFLVINLKNAQQYQFEIDYRWLSLAQHIIK